MLAFEEMQWAQDGKCVCKPCCNVRRQRAMFGGFGFNEQDCYYGRRLAYQAVVD